MHSYNVYRNGNKVTKVAATTFTDKNLNAGTEYTYQVSSIGVGELESARSVELKAKTSNEKVCYTDNNYNHVAKGRAHVSLGYALANGSNQNLGLYNLFVTTTLCKVKEGYYEME